MLERMRFATFREVLQVTPGHFAWRANSTRSQTKGVSNRARGLFLAPNEPAPDTPLADTPQARAFSPVTAGVCSRAWTALDAWYRAQDTAALPVTADIVITYLEARAALCHRSVPATGHTCSIPELDGALVWHGWRDALWHRSWTAALRQPQKVFRRTLATMEDKSLAWDEGAPVASALS